MGGVWSRPGVLNSPGCADVCRVRNLWWEFTMWRLGSRWALRSSIVVVSSASCSQGSSILYKRFSLSFILLQVRAWRLLYSEHNKTRGLCLQNHGTIVTISFLCWLQRLNQSMDVTTFVEELKDVLVCKIMLLVVFAAWFLCPVAMI